MALSDDDEDSDAEETKKRIAARKKGIKDRQQTGFGKSLRMSIIRDEDDDENKNWNWDWNSSVWLVGVEIICTEWTIIVLIAW